jgi:hypothetical protein
MRRWPGLVLVLFAGWLPGCVTGRPSPDSLAEHARPFQGVTGSDVVLLEVALLERPLGDAVIDRALWDLADEQVVTPERKAVLEDNGFRVGQVGGIPPTELQELLTTERSNPAPRRNWIHADNPTTLPLGPRLPQCRFELAQEGRRTPVSLEDVQCAVAVVPSLTPDGRTCLHCTPQVQHGRKQLALQPADSHTSSILKVAQPTESYAQLAWEVTLAPNEYVLVGTCFNRRGTLGHQCFVRPDEARPVQRLLAIRTGRPAKELPADALSEDEGEPDRSLPLALQMLLAPSGGSPK